MSQITLNIYASKPHKGVNYINPIQKDVLNSPTTKLPTIEELHFLTKVTQKEVKRNPTLAKKYVRVAVKTLALSLSVLAIIDPHLAFASQIAPEMIPVTNQPGTDMITSTDIIKLCKYLMGIALTLGFGIAMVVSVVASGWGYFRKTQDAFKWLIEIIKSFTMMMLAPTIIVTIALVAYLLFGGSEWFVKPF